MSAKVKSVQFLNQAYWLGVAGLSALILAVTFTPKAHAADSTSQAGAVSNAGSASQSASMSRGGNASVPITVNNGVGNGNGGQPNTSYYYGDQTVRTAPTVYAPSVVGGNLCAIGASGAVSFLGGGFAMGATWESKNCEERQRAALLYNMGEKRAAVELACNNRSTYDAMKRAGTPCVVRPEWEPKQEKVAEAPKNEKPVVVAAAPKQWIAPSNCHQDPRNGAYVCQ